MDKQLLQNLSSILSKLPKKDLEKNIEKAKSILKTSSKEDLQKILSNPQIEKILGNNLEIRKKELEKN